MLGIVQTPVAPTLIDPVPSSGLHHAQACVPLPLMHMCIHVQIYTNSARNALLYMLYKMVEVCLGPCTNCSEFYLNLSQNSLNSFLCVYEIEVSN